jgi:hypothetical protein
MLKRTLYILLALATIAAVALLVLNRGRYHSLLFVDSPASVEVAPQPAPVPVAEVETSEPTAAEATESADSLVSDSTIAPIVK